MGRKKIEIEPLPEPQIRAKFKKRKDGLRNKAFELGTLCGAQVALLVFSKDGDEVIEESVNGSIVEIFERYLRHLGRDLPGEGFSSHAQQMFARHHVSQALAGESHVSLNHVIYPEMGSNMPTNTSGMQYVPGYIPHVDGNGDGNYGVFQGQDISHYLQHAGQGGPQQFVAPSNAPYEYSRRPPSDAG